MVQPWAGLSDRYYTTNFRIQPMQGLHYTVRKKERTASGRKCGEGCSKKGAPLGPPCLRTASTWEVEKNIVVKTAGLQLDRGSSAHADVNQDNQDGTI